MFCLFRTLFLKPTMRIILLLLCLLLFLVYVSAYVPGGGASPVVYGNANAINNNQGNKVYSGYVHNNADHLHNNPNNIPHDHGPNEGQGTISPHEHGNVPREGHANPGGGGTVSPHAQGNIHNDGHGTINPHEHSNVPRDGHANPGGGGTINPHAHDNIHNDGHGTINPHEHGRVHNDGHAHPGGDGGTDIASMCARSKHPDICSSAIYSHPLVSPDNISLLKALTNAIIDSTKSTRRQTNSAASFGHVTGRAQEVVNDCMKNYDHALHDLEKAKKAIKMKDKALARHKFRDAVVEYGTCERALMEMPGAGQLAQQDVHLVKMAENCLSILDLI